MYNTIINNRSSYCGLLFVLYVVRADTADEIGPDSAWIEEPPEAGVAIRGKPYTIKCHSNLPNVTYRWIFNNRTLDLVNDSRRRILHDGSLYFTKVSTYSKFRAFQHIPERIAKHVGNMTIFLVSTYLLLHLISTCFY